MKVRRFATVAACAALISGCSSPSGPSDEDQAKDTCQSVVADQLKDPSSAQFRNVVVGAEQKAAAIDRIEVDDAGATIASTPNATGVYRKVVGEVSGVNGFGGRNGFRKFSCEAKRYDADAGKWEGVVNDIEGD